MELKKAQDNIYILQCAIKFGIDFISRLGICQNFFFTRKLLQSTKQKDHSVFPYPMINEN
jgi:hypothetical protein